MTDTTKKEFLERHNITEEELEMMVKESADYDLPKEEEEEEFDYGESDDWVWGYGNNKDPNEYVINISGGGDGVSPNGFENWVIKKVGGELKYYIRHGGDIPDKEQINKILLTCPDGNYISFQDKDYVFREGEMGFDWLEDELGETDYRMTTMIDNLTRANQFLQNIAEEQTKKIKEQEKEILSMMSLRSEDSLKLATLHNEKEELGVMADAYGTLKPEYERLQKDNKETLKIMKKLKKEVDELEEHYKWSIHTDWIAEAAGEDKEYYRDVCCADTLGRMIKENKELNQFKIENEDLKKKVANNKRFTDNAVTTLLHKGWTKGDCGLWCEPKSQPRDGEDWWKPFYDSFEDAIVGEYGDQSVQAKKYGFGVFKEG